MRYLRFKLEYLNPGSLSIKDRAALYMIKAAEAEGLLKPGGLIVEATAGNTGIALATIANARGYRTLFTCSPSTSPEKVDSLQRLGAHVQVCTSVPVGDPNHFQSVARQLADELGGFYTNQFYNLSNMDAHYNTTGPEIWNQTHGKIDAFVCAAGTGGTLAGTSIHYRS